MMIMLTELLTNPTFIWGCVSLCAVIGIVYLVYHAIEKNYKLKEVLRPIEIKSKAVRESLAEVIIFLRSISHELNTLTVQKDMEESSLRKIRAYVSDIRSDLAALQTSMEGETERKGSPILSKVQDPLQSIENRESGTTGSDSDSKASLKKPEER